MNAIDLTLLRARAEDAIERLLDLLDQIDGDGDLELEPDDEDGCDAEATHVWTIGGQGA
jgi:hypothetical protein